MALDRLTKIDGGGISTTSNYRVGIITASKFIGPFDGTGGNFSGVVTATNGVFSGNISAVDGNFSGNVTIGGTLTYEDVTNIDSVGIITARKDIHVGAGISAVGVITGRYLNPSSVSTQNVIIGWEQSTRNVTGNWNVLIGRRAGESLTSAGSAVCIGANAGQLLGGTSGIFIGGQAGSKVTGAGNLFIGGNAGQQTTSVSACTIIGNLAGIDNQGSNNTILGYYAGRGNSGVTDGAQNTFLGTQSGFKIEGGDDNTGVGYYTLRELTGGNKNVAIGRQAGDALVSGNNNIIIGYQADASTSTTSNEITLGDANINHLRIPGIGVSFNSTGGTQLGIVTATELDISGDIDVDGHTNLDNVSIAGITTTAGLLDVDGGISITGIDQNKVVFGSTNGGLQDSANLTFDGTTLGLTGSQTISGDIDVDGHTNLDNVSIVGVTTLSDSLRVGGHADITGGTPHDYNYGRGGQDGGLSVYASESAVEVVSTDDGTHGGSVLIRTTTDGAGFVYNPTDNALELKLFTPSGDNFAIHGTGNNVSSIETQLRVVKDGAVELYYNGTKHLETTSTGVSFNDLNLTNVGTIACDSLKGDADDNTNITFAGSDVITFKAGATSPALTINTTQVKVEDDQKITIGTGNDLTLWHNQSHSIIKNTTGRLYVLSDDLWFKNQADNSSLARFLNGDTSIFYYAGNEKLRTNATGITVTGEIAASQDYPNYRPTLDLNFAAEKKLDPRITYRRTGPASFTDKFGKVVKVGDNDPRFDHDPMTRESKGLLIEESRTNVAEVSEDFDDTTHWEKYSVTVTTNVATAPDGTLTADNIIPASGSAAARYLYFSNNEFPLSTSTTYTTSIFVKKNGLRYFAFQAHDNGSGSGHRAGFDLDNGTVVSGTPNNMGSASGVSASIVEFPNGWFRCILTGTTAGSGSIGRTAFCFSSALNAQASVGAITADGSNGGYVWGHQVEAGAFATSYIPTDLSTATRGTENVKIDGDDFTDFYNQSEGTLVSEFMINDMTTLTSGAIVNINALSTDSYADSIMFMEIGTSSGYYGRVYKNSNGTSLTGSGNITTNGIMGGTMFNKLSFAWSDTVVNEGLAAYRNGDLQGSSTTETNVPTNMTELRIGRGWASQYINAHIKRLMYYSKRLPDNQLATLTA